MNKIASYFPNMLQYIWQLYYLIIQKNSPQMGDTINYFVCYQALITHTHMHISSVESQKGTYTIFRDVPLRTRRGLPLYKVYGDCALWLPSDDISSHTQVIIFHHTPI